MLKSVGMAIIFLAFSFTTFSSTREEQKEEARELVQSKVSFIQKVLNNVQFDEVDSKEFILAIFGKNSASKDLYSALKSSMSGKSINGKPVTVKLFKRMNSVKAADLIYINGDTKVSLGDLKEKVGRKFVLLTEDFPYGQSMINFVVDEKNGLSYTIQEEALEQQGAQVGGALKTSNQRIFNERSWIERMSLAESKIKEQELTIVNQKDEIGEQSELIEKKSNTIENQESTISEKSQKLKEKAQIISYQRTIIIGGVIGAIIILGLLFFLFRINQKRKVALLESETKTKEIISSINYAERIQRASLPSSSVLEKSLKDGFVFYQPKDIVSGDFYWLEEHEDVVYFAVADCTGHGVPGALLSVLCSNSLSRSINELGIEEPAKILDQTVLHLEGFFSKSGDELQDGMDIALCRLDKSKNQLQYAGANRPLYYFTEGVFSEIKADRQPIGKYDYRKQFTNHVLHLRQGDSVYLFSDGIIDQFGGEKSKKFTSRRLKTLLQSINDQPMETQKQLIQEKFDEWRGENEPIDDVCMLGVRFIETASS